jgi:hypothetical protein
MLLLYFARRGSFSKNGNIFVTTIKCQKEIVRIGNKGGRCSMSLEENKAIVRRLYEAANKHNVDLADELVAPDFVDYTNKIEGLEGLKEFGRTFFRGFPDLHWSIEDIIAEGDKVWVRTTVTGTHKGEYRGVPPTGKKITMRCVDIWRIADGKIVEAWAVDDLLDFYKQLGIRVS